MTTTHTRDALMTDPLLVEIVTNEAKLVAKALRLDTIDAKEVYRSMVSACIQVAMAIAERDAGNQLFEFSPDGNRLISKVAKE